MSFILFSWIRKNLLIKGSFFFNAQAQFTYIENILFIETDNTLGKHIGANIHIADLFFALVSNLRLLVNAPNLLVNLLVSRL